ncbi:hypothetical protein A2331_04305 [Candidatus Falkowbacteria bacterium RIFOXYB2_FULL_34_18]|uniref:Sortase n=1 Tax=Candidatus Falkowbacteria bacterium RIFOXYD2_FULL_34_120 TaxID=1798007 RepID=A0A1F5TNR5_9BACT|nr:MAG: hypothetical protein A2500_04565 [Candidatus Falkowbacteria bacterium RIFOXYC12_FULL_34_55]OGF28889.1 MAG: hypothetical protein A2331_04305 [Candidatus Falkowbacteria bacterium RIFOXYB2_FULL_34_18]OGF35655.1 MAG: hypothetical protein A2466_04660 [Candidatus Falkowbacteria bacterium RIFOXYC2_FULL_34_220]OGF38401.1 MAG: hypothetical protein A2515_02965 [Candidatus Falkowbacteria bacterium RIFOXYD12_FULL_34_57]OGF40449.1 MAG: hypothetical protein A2531_02850 [Candidatus Falkowbacteria bact
MINKFIQFNIFLKILVFMLEFLAIGIFLYVVFLPFYPTIKYNIKYKNQNIEIEKNENKSSEENNNDADNDTQISESIRKRTEEILNRLPESEYAVSPNRVIIPKIGVNAPIVESESAEYGLSRGAWRLPESSTPDKGGNTIVTGHRFKYLPPHNLTFYLFHKLEKGDKISIIWNKEKLFYKIREIKIVEANDLSILNPTEEPIITLFTCHPIYSTKQRLVVIGELMKE